MHEKKILRKHTFLLRKTEYYNNTKKKLRCLIYKALLHNLQSKYCLHVPINTFDKGLKLMHVGPVLVNSKAVGGKKLRCI